MKFRPALFWDTEYNELDWDKHAKFIIERVLHRGTWNEFQQVLEYYGRNKNVETVKNLRYLEKRVMHFCRVYFDIPLSEMRCYNIRQSRKVHWDY